MLADRKMLDVSGFELIPILRHIWAKQITPYYTQWTPEMPRPAAPHLNVLWDRVAWQKPWHTKKDLSLLFSGGNSAGNWAEAWTYQAVQAGTMAHGTLVPANWVCNSFNIRWEILPSSCHGSKFAVLLSIGPKHSGLHMYWWRRPITNAWLNKCANVLWFLGPCSRPGWLQSGAQVLPHVSYQRHSIWFKFKSRWDVDRWLALPPFSTFVCEPKGNTEKTWNNTTSPNLIYWPL